MLTETLVICRSELAVALRNRTWLFMGLVQPVMYLLLFGPLLVRIALSTPGFPPGGAWKVLTPGLVVQLALLNSIFAGYTVLADDKAGVLERLQVTPVSRAALILGRVLVTVGLTLAQSVVLIGLAVVAFGLRAPLFGIVVVLLIAAFVSVSLSACSNALALRLRNEPAFSSLLNVVLLPLGLLSGILVPITAALAPTWLWAVSRANPLAHLVDVGRAAFRGEVPVPALLGAGALLAVMTALSLLWATRTYQRESL
ncbi:transport permease protein [Kineosporia sp. NBRC 101677]|uniref:ABC transporter permease n=1 Tax=Kineosporia sp. NBRC 101677 TaxID=3032197 RepID=UPI00249FC342|nr:ABC transporter permease [Kineosporia sp. NBRC 101677]GLY15207.1 transport permease protein [Kineosporia sp. NBRC 101677]